MPDPKRPTRDATDNMAQPGSDEIRAKLQEIAGLSDEELEDVSGGLAPGRLRPQPTLVA